MLFPHLIRPCRSPGLVQVLESPDPINGAIKGNVDLALFLLFLLFLLLFAFLAFLALLL